MGEVQMNPKFAIAIAYVNGDGEIIRFVRADKTEFDDKDYGEVEKRIPGSAILVTPNYCRWKLIDGQWR